MWYGDMGLTDGKKLKLRVASTTTWFVKAVLVFRVFLTARGVAGCDGWF